MEKNGNGQPLGQGSGVVAEAEPVLELMKKYRIQAVSDKMDLPPIRWMVEGLIEEKSPMTVVAQPKVGKTWLMLALAILLVLGGAFFGREINMTGPVIYFCGEGHVAQVMQRVDALLKAMGKTRGDLKGGLRISDKPWHMGDNRHRSEQDGLTDTQAEIMMVVKYVKPIMVFIDPMIRFTRGENEDKSYEMSPILNFILQELCRHTAVCVGHHTDKKGASPRGTGDWRGFMATELFLDGEPCKNKFKVDVLIRNAELPEPFHARVEMQSAVAEGRNVLDTARLVGEAGETSGVEADADLKKIVVAREIIQANPGIVSSHLRKKLKTRYKRAETLATLAGATRPEGGGWTVTGPIRSFQSGAFQVPEGRG